MSVEIKKIKILENIRPNAEWKKSNRDFLMAEIRNNLGSKVVRETWASELSAIVFPWKVFRLVARPVLAIFAIFSLVLGSGISVSASQLALPGDRLYPLKIATEKFQVAMTFDKEEAAKIHVELAGKRIGEVEKIKENSDSPEAKIQKINVAVDKFQEEVAAVGNKLENLNKEVPSQTTVEVAKIVDNKASEYKEALAKTTADLPIAGEAVQKINQGMNLVEEVGDKALAVIVENHVQGGAVSSEDDVLKRVEKKIENTEAKVAQMEGQINSLTVPQVEQMQKAAVQVKTVLAEARTALGQKEVAVALNKAMESKGLVKQAEQLATEIASAPPDDNPVCEECDDEEKIDNIDLTNTPADGTNTNTNTNSAVNTNTNTVKVYTRPAVKVTPPPPEPEPEIDESEMKVGIDLKQEPTSE